jgi:hypothetical protein
MLRLGDESGVYATDYDGAAVWGTNQSDNKTTGLITSRNLDVDAADLVTGMWRLVRFSEDQHLWYAEWDGMNEIDAAHHIGFAWRVLETDLTTIQLTTQGGTAAFDGGVAKVRYRGTPSSYIYEDLTGFTEVDSGSDLVVHKNRVEITNMQEDADSYVYKDYGASYFGDFVIRFEIDVNTVANTSETAFVCVSDTIGSKADMVAADDGLRMYVRADATGTDLWLVCESTDNSDSYQRTAYLANFHCEMERSGTTLTLKIYNDKFFTDLADTLTLTCEAGAKRYLSVLSSEDDAPETDVISGYIRNVRIVSVS